MSRPNPRVRRLWWLVPLVILGVGSAPALAQEATPAPRITDAPQRVRWHHEISILGHLDNGTAGMPVTLQRRVRGHGFHDLATTTAASDAGVAFSIPQARRSAAYRLVYRDEAGTETFSDIRRIRVQAGLSLHVSKHNLFTGRRLVLRGHLHPAVAGRRIVLQQRVKGSWRTIARPRVGDGSYRVAWHPRRRGHRRLRARFTGDAYNASAHEKRRIRVFEKDLATWYGPGFYGHRTACGRTLHRRTLGVANRHLPCGTRVSFMYRGRVVTVPVIDRGPFGRADWDLTRATARRLSFAGSSLVGSTR